MIKNNRIDALVEQTKGINKLLDIGTDHGYVLKKAIDLGYIKKGIAADISEGPLSNAKKNLHGYPVNFYLSNGFEKIDENYDGVLIAGMGSHLINNILSDNLKEDVIYILQANGKYDILRRYLKNNGYRIIDEVLVFDKFYYVIIKAVKGYMEISEKEVYLGPILMTKKSSENYYRHLLERYYQLEKVSKGNNKVSILQKVKWLEDVLG